MQSNGEPPNSVQQQQYTQASGCVSLRVSVCACVCLVGLANAAAESPFMTAFLIFLETAEAVCCVGSVPSDNSNLQRHLVWAQFPPPLFLLTFSLPFFCSPLNS